MAIVYKDGHTYQNTILLVGNGFDLSLNLRTSYVDFITYVLLLRVVRIFQIIIFDKLNLSDIDDANALIDKNIKFVDYINSKLQVEDVDRVCSLYATAKKEVNQKKWNEISEIINGKFFKNFLYLLFSEKNVRDFFDDDVLLAFDDNLNKDNIKNVLHFDGAFNKYKVFELAGKYNSLTEFSLNKFCDLINRLNFVSKSIAGWVDIEQFIEFCVEKAEYLENKFTSFQSFVPLFFKTDLPISQLDELTDEYFNSLLNFSDLFCDFLRKINSYNSVNILKDLATYNLRNYCKSLNNRSDQLIESIDFNRISSIIDFNYTPSTKYLFKLNDSKKISQIDPKIYHVNGQYYDEDDFNNIVFGFNSSNNFDKSNCYLFQKKYQRVYKNVKSINYDELKVILESNKKANRFNLFDLIVFGHSCSVADSDIFKNLLTAKNLNTAVICCYKKIDLIKIINNLIHIVGEDYFQYLMRADAKHNRLFFAVSDEG